MLYSCRGVEIPMMQNTLNIKVYAPALVGDDKRPLAIVHELERTLPGIRLEWTVSEDRQLVAPSPRDTWLVQAIRRGGFPVICNNDESHPVTVFGLESPAETGPGGHALLDVDAQMPLDAAGITAAADVLEGVAEGARAYWGHATPFRAGVEISRQTRDPVRKPGVPPRGLPVLKLPEDIARPRFRIAWGG
jgi:uncharacterized protein DUF5953